MNPWFAFYPGDYGRDTAHLSLVQHGAYRLLLDHYYSTGAPLPLELSALYRICRAFDESERAAVDFVIGQFFIKQEDGHYNSRADSELKKRAIQHERLSNGAKKAMRNRWGVDSQASKLLIKQAIARPQPQPQPQKKSSSAALQLPRSPLWKEIGVSPEDLPAEFVELCERLYAAKGDQSLFDLLGICMDVWQGLGNPIPAVFAKAKARLKNSMPLEPSPPIPVVETEEWGVTANCQAGAR